MSQEHTYSPGERAILQEIRVLRRELNQEVEQMDAAGEALQAELQKVDTEEQETLAEVKAGGEAIVAAGTKFTELKELLAKQAGGALSDEEAAKLTTLADEVGTHIGEATTQLTEHVKQLNEEAAAA